MSDSGLRVVSVHGADKHTDITKKLFLPATLGFVEAGTVLKAADGYYGVVQGAANTDTPKVCLNSRIPEDYVSLIALKAVWTSPAVSGDMQWYFEVALALVGESYVTREVTPSPRYTATAGSKLVNVTDGGIAFYEEVAVAGTYFGIRFVRMGSSGDDTLDDTVDLLGFLFEYIANQ